MPELEPVVDSASTDDQIDQNNARYIHTHADGSIETAASVEEARARCKDYLGKLTVEEATNTLETNHRYSEAKKEVESDPNKKIDLAKVFPSIANKKVEPSNKPQKREVKQAETTLPESADSTTEATYVAEPIPNPTKVSDAETEGQLALQKAVGELNEALADTHAQIDSLNAHTNQMDTTQLHDLAVARQHQNELEHEAQAMARRFAEQQIAEQTELPAVQSELPQTTGPTGQEHIVTPFTFVEEQVQTSPDRVIQPTIDPPPVAFTEAEIQIRPIEDAAEEADITFMEDFLAADQQEEITIVDELHEQAEFEIIESLPLPVEMQQDEVGIIDAIESANIATEVSPDIAELTLELKDLFNHSEEQLPASEQSAVAEPETQSDLKTTEAEEPVVDLLRPYQQALHELIMENQPLEPELAEAITRLEQAFTVQEVDQPELIEQMVEDIIVILTTLGCQEPKKLLISYAKQHSLEEFYTQLMQEIPDLTKLIDYQQHLLKALNQAVTHSDRRQTIAQLLRNLLFILDTRIAEQTA